MRPLAQGGLAFPDFYKYFLAAQLVMVGEWLDPDKYNSFTMLEAAVVHSFEATQALPFRGLKTVYDLTPPMITTIKAWRAGLVGGKTFQGDYISKYSVVDKSSVSHLNSIQDPGAWTKFRVKKRSQVVQGETMI